MTDALSLMLWPLLACFVLVGIHAYLGIHVLARKVIFVDLALAQIAALGAVYGVFLGLSFDADPIGIKIISVIFTLLGAVVFSFTRTSDDKIPHEAIIGIIYAAALSMTILITANLPHGADEVRQMLAGSILWVTPKEVIFTAVLYAGIGAVHVLFRKQFFALSDEISLKASKSWHTQVWDFLFYATFGVVVTSSVGIGGVLLVFGFLVIPSVIGVFLGRSLRERLVIGWASGALMSTLGVFISYHLDLPSGPTIVVLLGALLIVIAIVRELFYRESRKLGLLHGATLSLALACLIISPIYVQKIIANNKYQHRVLEHQLGHDVADDLQIQLIKKILRQNNAHETVTVLSGLGDEQARALLPEISRLISHQDHRIREQVVAKIKNYGDETFLPILKAAFAKEKDDFLRIDLAVSVLSLKDKTGFKFLLNIINAKSSDLAKEDAWFHLREQIDYAPADNKALESLVKNRLDDLKFNEATKKFSL